MDMYLILEVVIISRDIVVALPLSTIPQRVLKLDKFTKCIPISQREML